MNNMICFGTIVNVIAIIAGGSVGLILKKFLSNRITETIMQSIGLAVIIIGFSGSLSSIFTIDKDKLCSNYILLMIISLASGSLIGELIKIESKLELFAKFCERKFLTKDDTSTFAHGLVTAALVFCIGSMAIVGSLEEGINKSSNTLLAKSVLDGITAMIFASSMGVGVLFAAFIVGIYQGSITLLGIFIEPYLVDTVITQMSVVGYILIIAIGFNMLNITKIKVGNMLPAIFIPVLYHALKNYSNLLMY